MVRYFLRSRFLPFRTIDFYPAWFHQLTNPSFRKSFVLSSIQNPGGGVPLFALSVDCRLFTTHYPLSFLSFADSLAQLQNSSPFLSRKSELFQQKCRVWH